MVLSVKDSSANAREVRGKGLIPGISGRFSGGSRNFPGGSDCKASAYNVGDLGSIPWRRKWQPSPVFLPGKSHGRRSLVGHMGAKSRTQLSGFTFTVFSGGGHANQLLPTNQPILAWRISCTEDSGRLQSIESQRVGQD